MRAAPDLPPGTDMSERRTFKDLLGPDGRQRAADVCASGPNLAASKPRSGLGSLIAHDHPIGIRRAHLVEELPAKVWRRIAKMGEPELGGDPYIQRLNCVTVQALIRTALVDFDNLDRGLLTQHMAIENALAEAFQKLGDHYRSKGIYR